MAKNIKELTEAEKLCLAGYALTGDIETAYRLSRKNFIQKPDAKNHRKMALTWLREKGCKDYLSYINNTQPTLIDDDIDTGGKTYREKESVILEMEELIPTLSGTDRLNALMKISDLQGFKKDDLKTEEDRVLFYLPLPYCKDCPHRFNLGKERENWKGRGNSDQETEEVKKRSDIGIS